MADGETTDPNPKTAGNRSFSDPEVSERSSGISTQAVHAGENQSVPRRSATVPIYQTAPFLFDTCDEMTAAFDDERHLAIYSREANPTVRAVEDKLAQLEGAEDAVAFASGMAAISGALSTLIGSGKRLIAAAEIYGGTDTWLGWLSDRHLEVVIERPRQDDLVDQLASIDIADTTSRPAVVYVETPTNPLLRCCDLAEIAKQCRRLDARLVVDNTFASPILQNPLALGADIVVHSATKYLAGHSDTTAGLAAGSAELMKALRQTQIVAGACLDPHAAFLVGRGMKTLALRVERQTDNAERLADWLEQHPKAARVHYPGNDPIARRQMRRGGAMLAFELVHDVEPRRFIDRLRLVAIIPSLGGVETGVVLPAESSHRRLSPEQRAELGITDGLVRVSCGIEDATDLVHDFAQALDAA